MELSLGRVAITVFQISWDNIFITGRACQAIERSSLMRDEQKKTRQLRGPVVSISWVRQPPAVRFPPLSLHQLLPFSQGYRLDLVQLHLSPSYAARLPGKLVPISGCQPN
ncbi:hypothetical protein FRC19_008111 [Serendipita sp. 401]|nr:hypothetical protein FRC19_008111 [Serendipita sp. 401]